MEYEKYPFEPWRDKAVLANFTKNLHDYLASLDTMKETYDRAFTKGKVSTAWLEGIINVLRNELIAETANVSITDTDGILITNGADTKALSLKGGIFAIANSKTGNSWNWRTFGTGDGFTADCIVTGKILTSLVEIVGDAVEGENKFYWDATGLYAVDPNNANRYMVLNKEGLRGYVNGILRLHLGPYAADKFGLLLRASDGVTTILDEDGIMQTWQEGRADNVDGSHPLTLNIYLPPETKSVYKALLRFRLQAFRAYETGAESGGGTVVTAYKSNTQAVAGDGTYKDVDALISSDMSVISGSKSGWMLSAGSHSHSVYSAGSHQHAYWDDPIGANVTDYGGSHSHDMSSAGSHVHDIYGHRHHITHEHNVTIQSHNHEIQYGIYTGTSATGITIKINGTDRTAALGDPFNSDQDGLNISSWLSLNQWNTVELGSSRLGRIDASIFIQAKMGI